MGEHRHAVERDLIQLGKDEEFDAGLLPLRKLVAIVLAAQPGTSTYHARHDGWTPEGHLLASQLEHQAGLVDVTRRVPRQGVKAEAPRERARPANPNRLDSWDTHTLEEFERLRAENYAKGQAPTRRIGPERTKTRGGGAK